MDTETVLVETTNQEDTDYAYLDGELSDQEHEDQTQINYLSGGQK